MSVPPDQQPPTTRIPSAGRFDQPAGTTPPGTPQPAPAAHQAPPAVTPPAFAPVPEQQAAPVPPGPESLRPSIIPGPYWAGVAATAVVALLVGVVGVVVFESILDVDLVTQDPFDTGSTTTAYVIGGIATALVAGLLLYALVLSTPKPRAFFGWIMGLGTLVMALLPLTWTDDVTSALCSGLVNLLIGIAVWSLLAGVLSRTVRMVPGR